MKISEIIDIVDMIEPNMFDPSTKVQWLSDLDHTVWLTVILTHEHEAVEWSPYGQDDIDRELLIPEPYARRCYEYYLRGKIAESNLEANRSNQLGVVFNSAYQDFTNYYNRNHLPLPAKDGNRLRL